jgi:hypothetical protein
VLSPDEILRFSVQIDNLLKLPEAPQHEQPYSENESSFLNATLREQRVLAANGYASKAREYAERMKQEIARQRMQGAWFDCKKIEGEGSRLLEQCERRLALENISLKFLVSSGEELDAEGWSMVRLVLLLVGCIGGIVSLAIVGTNENARGMTDELIVDLNAGLDETELRKKKSVLSHYLSDIEKINGTDSVYDDSDKTS